MYKVFTASFYGLDHTKVADEYDGAEFAGEFQIKDMNGNWTPLPVAVYYLHHEDKYLFFFNKDGELMIGEKDALEMLEDNASQEGIHCNICDYVVYSKFRHDNAKCYCGNANVEGGRDFFKYEAKKMEEITAVNINFITGDINPLRRILQ